MKYPELPDAIEAAGNVVRYATAFMRLEHGWTMERAVSTPVQARGPRRSWAEKVAERNAARLAKAQARATSVPKVRPRYIPRAKDTSPYHIARIRAAYCDEFLKTGVLNPELASKLKAYADEKRTHAEHLDRVPSEHETRRYGREATRAGDLGSGDANQIDGAAADRIRSFLRLP